MQVQVIRKFPGSEPEGSIMDTTNWMPNRAHQLIKRRFVQPLAFVTPAPEPSRKKAER